ncbi:MAG TPA: hypothetical protein VGO56_15470 [Pyrinomonadaceae bacterium]|jgi:hypothetical protein|nr:hypothetical protein [Pyrinomonadaceae bacterium]
MHAVRVYGSDSSFGQEPQQNPYSGPIALQNFPVEGEVAEVLLGEPPKLMFEAHRRKTALANIRLDMTFGGGMQITDDDAFNDAIRDQLANEQTVPTIRNCSWYITISIQREIEVDDELIVANGYPLVRIPETIRFREFRQYASPYINHVASIVSTVAGTEFFEEVLLDEVLFSGPSGVVTRLPERNDFKMSARASVSRSMDSLDLSTLRALLSSERLQPYARNRWLERAVYWHAATLNEPDHWKSFQWAFLSLEILIHKVSKRLYGRVRNSFAFTKSDGELLPGFPMADLFGSEERLPLVAKFCIVALGLSPDTAGDDILGFKKAKEARDRFSHGDITDESELPLHSVKELSTRYLKAVFLATSLW